MYKILNISGIPFNSSNRYLKLMKSIFIWTFFKFGISISQLIDKTISLQQGIYEALFHADKYYIWSSLWNNLHQISGLVLSLSWGGMLAHSEFYGNCLYIINTHIQVVIRQLVLSNIVLIEMAVYLLTLLSFI